MRRPLIAACAGVLFGIGLAVSGMFDPAKVLGFLDIAAVANGGWDPSLAFVMAGGLVVAGPAFQLARRRPRPLAAATFQEPNATRIDRRLAVGAAIFGIGWGMVGYCPGPALAALAFGASGTILFVLSMTIGMLLETFLARRGKIACRFDNGLDSSRD